MLSDHPSNPSQPVDALSSTQNLTVLQRSPSSIPGREIVQVLTEIQAGAESGWHVHPGEEVVYIIAGTVEMTIEGRPSLTLSAGDPFLVPPRTPHNGRTIGSETGQMISTYFVAVWEPLTWFTRMTVASLPTHDTNHGVQVGEAPHEVMTMGMQQVRNR